MNEKNKPILGYLFGFIGGLIILLMKDSERNTKIHGAQSIVISVAYVLLSTTCGFIFYDTAFFTLGLFVCWIALVIMGITKANKGEDPMLPVIGDIAMSIFKKQIDEGNDDGPIGPSE